MLYYLNFAADVVDIVKKWKFKKLQLNVL